MSETLTRRRRFAQIPDDLITDPAVSANAIRVWGRLDRYAGRSGSAMPSRAVLADDLGVSEETIKRAYAELTAAGWISRARIGTSNAWQVVLNDEPITPLGGPAKGRPAGGSKVIRGRQQRVTVDPLPAEERVTSDPIDAQKNGSRNGSPVTRPRKEKTNDSERTTSSHVGVQLAVIDADTDAAIAATDGASRRPTVDRGTRIPEDWYPDQALIEWTRENAPDVGPRDVEEFRNYWLSVPGAKGRKTRWDLTWRNRAIEVQGRHAMRRQPRPGVYDPARSRAVSLNVAEACELAGVSNIIELMIKESGE